VKFYYDITLGRNNIAIGIKFNNNYPYFILIGWNFTENSAVYQSNFILIIDSRTHSREDKSVQELTI
jgi:hypothetical protein